VKRKIIQIQSTPDNDEIIALCDDGTVWNGRFNEMKGNNHAYKWRQVLGFPEEINDEVNHD
jgi:hypothetical protein